MKNPNFIVKVPEPCHEDWNKMQPDEKGKFCLSCSKSVIDFTNKTDEEIKNILLENKNQKVCGHFKSSQLNRPLNYIIDPIQLPRNISFSKAFAIALFFVFGSMLFSCTNQKNEDLNVIGGMEAISESYLTGAPIPQNITNQDFIQKDTLTYDLPQTDIETYMEPLIDGGVTITGSVGSYYNLTNKDIEGVDDSAVKSNDIRYATLGLMEVEIIQGDSITNDSTQQNNISTKIGDNVIYSKTNLSVYPNPNNGEFTIKYDILKSADVLVEIYDIKGSLIKTVSNISNQYSGKYQIPVSIQGMSNGIYIVSLIRNGEKYTEKIIIE